MHMFLLFLFLLMSQVDEDDLYWSVGDGGPPFDPNNFASNLDTLLGSIIRITVPRGSTANTETKYSIPDGNAQGETT